MTKISAEAQNQFGQLLDLVQREPVAITRHGRPAAYIISLRDMQELISLKDRRSQAVKEFEDWFRQYGDRISPEAEKLTDEKINRNGSRVAMIQRAVLDTSTLVGSDPTSNLNFQESSISRAETVMRCASALRR